MGTRFVFFYFFFFFLLFSEIANIVLFPTQRYSLSFVALNEALSSTSLGDNISTNSFSNLGKFIYVFSSEKLRNSCTTKCCIIKALIFYHLPKT